MCGEIGGHGDVHWDFHLLDLSIWADSEWVICPHFKVVTPPRANLDFLFSLRLWLIPRSISPKTNPKLSEIYPTKAFPNIARGASRLFTKPVLPRDFSLDPSFLSFFLSEKGKEIGLEWSAWGNGARGGPLRGRLLVASVLGTESRPPPGANQMVWVLRGTFPKTARGASRLSVPPAAMPRRRSRREPPLHRTRFATRFFP